MQSPPFPRYLVPPSSKYSPQHHVLKHPQLPFLEQCQRPTVTDPKYLVRRTQEVTNSERKVITTACRQSPRIFNRYDTQIYFCPNSCNWTVFVPTNSVDYVNRSQVIHRWEQLGIHTRELIFMLDAFVFNCLFI